MKHNGSYLIKDKNSDNYLRNNKDVLQLNQLIENDYNFEFYLENTNNLFMENTSEYTNDGRFIKSTTDTLFNKTIYDIDEITGLTKSITNPKNQITNYEYNKDGIRTSKTVNNEETKFYLENSKVVLAIKGNNSIYYMYNEVEDLIGFKYNDEVYYYIKNAQNDIIGILDSNYNEVVRYSYDSWGNLYQL